LKILVTGASGFVGSHIIEALAAAGHEVRGVSRSLPTGIRRKAGVDYRDGFDVPDSNKVPLALFEGIEVVVHLVGIIQEGRGGQTFQRIHVDGTKNVVDKAVAAGSVKRFIYMSAIGTAEDAPAEYSRTKFAAEQFVKKSGIPYTIFRPSLIIGKDGEFVEQIGDLIKHGGLPVNLPFPFIPVPGSGLNKFQPIYVDDLCECVVKSLVDDRTANQTYEVGGAQQLNFNELLSKMAAALKVHKPMLHAPIPILRIAATVLEAILPKPPVTRDQLKNLGRDNITSSTAVHDVFGVEPLAFDDMIPRIYTPS
jgi:NADH dehydrogenase